MTLDVKRFGRGGRVVFHIPNLKVNGGFVCASGVADMVRGPRM